MTIRTLPRALHIAALSFALAIPGLVSADVV